ncbi:beta-carotene 15,15'-monooxygenase [Paenibacillus xylanilyticus]|uniref:beta-carotene 15,15'-monooxygenase n=1 Tax=Paenibacillus xylanilyticus TaxID=248903 RepID=UPI0039A20742
MTWIEKAKPMWFMMLVLIFSGNFMLYQTTIGSKILSEKNHFIVLGSMLDLIILLPLFLMLYRNKFTLKSAIILPALGCILIRFLIPISLLEPYETITLIGIVLEGCIIFFEVLLIITFVRYMPKILTDVKRSNLPVVFSFSQAVRHYVRNNSIIQIICSELLMLYYAFSSWKNTAPIGITMYKKSSFIAFQIMLMHAMILETLGVHYWLHEIAPILSIILLVLNIYTVIFFLANIQALRLNPIHFANDSFYLPLGLTKRAKIDLSNIELLIEDSTILESKLSKDTIDFVIRDFEKVCPDLILKMKTPQKVTLFMGIEKEYNYVAIKTDDPIELKELIKAKMN